MQGDSYFAGLARGLKKLLTGVFFASDVDRLERFASENELMSLIKHNNVRQLQILLEKLQIGADERVYPSLNMTCLSYAVVLGRKEAVRLFLAWNASADHQDDFLVSPVMRAAARNDVDILELLLERKPDLALRDELGRTALDFARYYDSCEAMEVLSQHSALPPARERGSV